MEYFRTGEVLQLAWQKFRAHWAFSLMVMGALIVSQILLGIIDEITKDWPIWSALSSLLGLVVAVIVSIGMTRLFLGLIDSDAEGKLGILLSPEKSVFWASLWGTLLYWLLVGFGYVLLVVPGVYFMLKYQFYSELIVDKKVGVLEAFHKSAEITQGIKWQLLGFLLVCVGVSMLGILALGVGLLVALPVMTIAYYMVYRKLSLRLEAIPTPLPTSVTPASDTLPPSVGL